MTTIFIIIILLLAPTISAKSSDAFIEHLTDLMWKDCKGKDIHINQPIIRLNAANQTLNLTKWPPSEEDLRQEDFVDSMNWPYSKDLLRQIIQLLSEQPYRTYIGQCDGDYSMVSNTGWEGCGVLTSGNNKLNINYDTYYWNREKVDVPKEELYNIASGNNNTQVISKGEGSSINMGNNNIANTGNNNTITQKDLNISFTNGFSIGAILGIFLTYILNILYDIWGRDHLKRWFKKK
jgi:hypothetical protein